VELVERATILAQLQALNAAAHSGSGSVVVLAGESGIGKTSVMRALANDHSSPRRVLWGSCEPLVVPEPLGPFHDMAPIAPLVDAGAPRIKLLRSLLAELATPPVTLMVVDDVQWADDATLDAIRFLGRRVHGTTGMLLISYRDDEAQPGSPLRAVLGDLATAPGAHRIEVPPLSAVGVAMLADGYAIDAARLHAATAGNPFYVTEVLAAPGWTVPRTVVDAVLARIARLDPSARELLEVVSVAPGGLEPALAMAVAGSEPGDADTCLDRGVLVMAGRRLAFRHELARLAIAGSMPASRLVALHRHLLDRLEMAATTDSARLAHHADAAGDLAAAVRHASVAAREASRRGAHRAAAEHLSRAVAADSSASPAEFADLVSRWADERTLFDDPRPVLDLRRRSVALFRQIGDRHREGGELVELARMTMRVGDALAAARLAEEAMAILGALPPSAELARALASVGYLAAGDFRFDVAFRRATRAIALAKEVGDSASVIVALQVRGMCETAQGRSDDAIESYGEAYRLAIEVGDLDLAVASMVDVGLELYSMKRYEEASKSLVAAIELGRSIDLDFRVSLAEATLAQIAFEQGRWDEAESEARRLLTEWPDFPDTRVWALTTLARLQVRRGDTAAGSTLNEVSSITERGESQDVSDLAAGQAEQAWLTGRSADIRSIVTPQYEAVTAECAHWPPARWPVGELAFWLWRAGAITNAPIQAAEPWALHIEGDWLNAAAIWEQVGCPYEQAEALADGDEPAMRAALAMFSRLGAQPAADRLRDQMRRMGVRHVPARPRRSTRSAPANLTRRQLEILELLENGLTDRQIAHRLFITQKTAGHHVSAILAKLGASSRTEAAATARKMGIVVAQT